MKTGSAARLGENVGRRLMEDAIGSSSSDRLAGWIDRHWLLIFNLAMGLLITGSILAPALMSLGLEPVARPLYALYGLTCHQLPERSYFLFGPDGVNSYSGEQVVAWGADPERLRQFVGGGELGFKMSVAQRNSAIYATLFLAGLAYGLLRKRVRGLNGRAALLMLLPIVLDGGSHMVSELTRLGFRESNGWLAALTGYLLPSTFYAGTTIGSFNWLMRTVTGAIAALVIVWLAYPYLERGFTQREIQTP